MLLLCIGIFGVCQESKDLSWQQSEIKQSKKLVDQGKFEDALEILNRCTQFQLSALADNIGSNPNAEQNAVSHRLRRRSAEDFDMLLLLGRCLNGLDRLDEAAVVLVAAAAKAYLLSPCPRQGT